MTLVLNVLKILFDFLNAILMMVLWIISPVVIMIFLNILFLKLKGYKRIKSKSKWKQKGIFRRILWDFPKQFALDFMTGDPNKYPYHGTVMFCGRQGCGKTISMVYFIQKVSKKYPESLSYANFQLFMEAGDESSVVPLFNGWKGIVENNNGEKGITFCIDELTIWFNNKDSRDFPPEFLQDLNQQRKQRKMTIGTAQRFGLLAKDLRALPEYVYLPHTIAKSLTIVLVARPEDWNDEKNKFNRYEWFKTWFFVQDQKLRESYDTFERVQRSAREGFEPNKFIAGSTARAQ
jgi:hypothetical protein